LYWGFTRPAENSLFDRDYFLTTIIGQGLLGFNVPVPVGASLADYRRKTKGGDPTELQVARQELAGHLSLVEGRTDRALKQFQAASKAERRLTYTEPPFYPRPVAEVWGRVAAKANKPSLSARAFAIAVPMCPAISSKKLR